MITALHQRVNEIQQALRETDIDGWLFYDFRGSDPLPIASFSSTRRSM